MGFLSFPIFNSILNSISNILPDDEYQMNINYYIGFIAHSQYAKIDTDR